MSVSNCARLVWKYKWHWNRKLLSLSSLVLLKMLEMWALVLYKLILRPEVWLVFRILTSQPSTLANCSLVLSLWWSLDCEQVKDVSLLTVKLVIGLVVEASSQLGLLSIEMILGPETGKTVQPSWIVLEEDLGEEWSLWWICFEHHRAFGR